MATSPQSLFLTPMRSPRDQVSRSAQGPRLQLPTQSPKQSIGKIVVPSPSSTRTSGSPRVLSRVSTPSTCVETTDLALSLCSDSSPADTPGSFKMSLNLATSSADKSYVEQAKDILTDGPESLKKHFRDRSFLAAMARQGVQTGDLKITSKLSNARKVTVLAAVLQDKDTNNDALCLDYPRSARVYQNQTQRRYEESLERQQMNFASRDKVSQSQTYLHMQSRAHSEERFMSDSQRLQRVRSRDGDMALARQNSMDQSNYDWNRKVDQGSQRLADRVGKAQANVSALEDKYDKMLRDRATTGDRYRMRQQDSHNAWQQTVEQGTQRLAERIAERQAFINAQEDRLANRQQELDDERNQVRGNLQSRFMLVQQSAVCSHREAEAKAMRGQDSLEKKLMRSREHQQAVAREADRNRQLRDEKRQDRNHQRDRVWRVKDYQNQQKQAAFDEDSEILSDCRRLQERMKNELTRRAVDKGLPLR